jgi:branched-chain amino acid transport system permease protein
MTTLALRQKLGSSLSLSTEKTAWLLILAVAALPLLKIPFTTWAVLTLAGLAMGMMLFTMASGLTLVFGLMGVMNFAHGAFITVGAYVATSVVARVQGSMESPALTSNLGALGLCLLAAGIVAGLAGLFFERVIVRPVYGAHMKQILITMGGLIVAEQLMTVTWGVDAIPLPKPAALAGSLMLGDVAVGKFRLLAALVGLCIYGVLHLMLNRTRLGLVIRAGVENREMVEALGYRIGVVFIGVFIAGAALAGIGGGLWGMYQEMVTAQMGSEVMLTTFIVLIIGGLGSVHGCFVAALLVGLTSNYVGFLSPKLALGSNILLMVAILMWKPQGLFPATKT